jgi:hypothetical protein
MTQGRVSPWFLLTLAIFVILGHICAAPVHVHAGTVTTHNEDNPEHGGDEAAHGGSCETLRADFSFDVPALIPTGAILPVGPGFRDRPRYTALTPAAASSPPLFLLHASLLI